MPHTEGIPRGDEVPQKVPRGPSTAATERVATREQAREAKGEKYREVQNKIRALEEDLLQNNNRAIMEKDPSVRELATAIGRKLYQEIQALKGDKERLEEEIRNLGGNPGDYTIQ